MKIHIASAGFRPGESRSQKELLQSLWAESSRTHSLIESAEDAELIIICDITSDNWYRTLRSCETVHRHAGKCFAVCEDWKLLPLLRGIYVNSHRKLPLTSRLRTGCYNLFFPEFRNPFTMGAIPRGYEYPKNYLATFVGRDCHPSRAALLAQHWSREDILLCDSSHFDVFTFEIEGKEERQKQYAERILASKFSICPRGVGAASMRVFESMRLGVAPVILSDEWIYPNGPDWDEFAIRWPENGAARLESELVKRENDYSAMGKAARLAHERFFAAAVYFDYLIELMQDISRSQKLSESAYWKLRDVVLAAAMLRHSVSTAVMAIRKSP